ncbi:hypothetical protein, partial [Nonomuraea rubra]|uniref:hypothetical protein n=1 Tax=Nonomuraea rubra TaxID=46180 RepID=UPI0031EDCF7D
SRSRPGALLRASRSTTPPAPGWRPRGARAGVRGRGDKGRAYANSRYCLRDLRAGPGQGDVEDVGDVDHMTSATVAPEVSMVHHTLRRA